MELKGKRKIQNYQIMHKKKNRPYQIVLVKKIAIVILNINQVKTVPL